MQCVCRFVNRMNTDLSRDEFLLLVPELADHIRTGKPFDKDVIKFLYWRRPRMGPV